MATLPNVNPLDQDSATIAPAVKPLLVCLPSMASEASDATVRAVANAFRGQTVLVASPDYSAEQPAVDGRPHLVPYPTPRSDGEWVLNAADYVAASDLAEDRGAGAVLLLGPDAASLHHSALTAMQQGLAAGADVALPRYRTSTDDGLVNSALIYPITRALFADIRFPLPLDLGLSPRMLRRLADVADRNLQQSAEAALLWPVAEASVAGFTLRQVEGGERLLPQPSESDLNVLFPAVTGSLFTDLENKAAFWQRARVATASRPTARGGHATTGGVSEEVRTLVENYKGAFNNLREIWALVLPPQSLLALKKLSVSAPENFNFSSSLWARTVYDFALAFHLRSLNRGHLLGAFTPLYLAWVASFLRSSEVGEVDQAELLEFTAHAFEQEKPYLVSRWRWPDRFNP